MLYHWATSPWFSVTLSSSSASYKLGLDDGNSNGPAASCCIMRQLSSMSLVLGVCHPIAQRCRCCLELPTQKVEISSKAYESGQQSPLLIMTPRKKKAKGTSYLLMAIVQLTRCWVASVTKQFACSSEQQRWIWTSNKEFVERQSSSHRFAVLRVQDESVVVGEEGVF